MANDMRIGGLASGMDIDKIVGDLMKAERMPLDKMEREKTSLTWKRDAYRDVNKQLFEMENMAFDMKLEKSYNSKSTSSTDSSAVTASATSDAGNGNYKVEVNQLASAAYNLSETGISASGSDKIDPDATLSSQKSKFNNNNFNIGDTFTLKTYNEEGAQSETFKVESGDSLNDVLKKISNSGLGLRAFYEESSDKVMIERTKEGNFNSDSNEFLGAEIGFDGSTAPFLADTLGIKNGDNSSGTWELNEKGGNDAKFTYNGEMNITSHTNEYTLNGVNFKFNKETTSPVSVNVTNNVDSAIEKITKFVDKYNKIIEDVGGRISEQKNRDYQPLTDKQKEGMEEKEIELWEKQAKKGLLHSDSTLQGAMFEMRNEWYQSVNTSGQFSQLSEIGIETSSSYRDNGKLIIDEDKLRQALTEDSASVSKLFVGEGETEGIADKLKSTLNETIKQVERKAGKPSSVPSSYNLGESITQIDDEMDAFQDRLNQIEDRYWSQFTQMEKAIQKMNSQSNYMMQQFG
ncbi:flagellar hook-associated protein 2 [Pontibacillus yanchengensis]|uniref:Flagellar hook-associated protein 2 n=1 Tax=Pontibacillus yanchengensis Y32 TaxID=1385514 RepID=A0A0A2TDD0_9BACI|nr:flagellar hook-associated protein 2 [Pontibacillus yanchengensis]KGP73569.1 flagellar cap protein FliD [Pontibacillus yanchengensis Y32]